MTDFVNTPCPKGESFIDLHNRVKDFLTNLKTEKQNNVAIITHGGVIRSIIAHIQKENLKNAFNREINYGTINRLVL